MPKNIDQLIINSPYEEPREYWKRDAESKLFSRAPGWGQTFTHIWTSNSRLQPARIQLYGTGDGASSPLCSASTDTYTNFDFSFSFADASGHNNGNVTTIAFVPDLRRTQNFTYDSLNRLATAETLHQNQPWWQGDPPLLNCWGEQFNYDAWGNLSGISPVSSAYTGCTQENWSMTATTKNQLQDTNNDYVYDAAGNLIQPGPIGGPYVFDAENHLTSAGGMAYLYDGDGKRVGKAPASTPTQPNYLYWYGIGSDILEETDGDGNYLYRDFRFNGMLLARGEDDWVDHFFADALGNTRCVYGDNDPDGGCSDYYPFGGERPIPSCCPTNPGGVNVSFKFTGKERDSESGLDNFGARYNSSNFGRFMSPDWSAAPTGVPYADFADHQSLNLYSYARNRPLANIDRDGHCIFGLDTVVCVYVAAAVVVAGIAWGLHKMTGHVEKGLEAATKVRNENQAALDAAGRGDAQTAEQKDDQAKQDTKDALKEAQEAAKEGMQIPGTSTAGDIGLTAPDAAVGIVTAVGVAAEQHAIDKKEQKKEQQQQQKQQKQQQQPPSPPPCVKDANHSCPN